ncbi:ecto-NOX disulfide-thiol exchanger 2-like isoform X1 [Helicoverpa zea]|uniref:ecto-NOX disulfide-thiol exchanger 2-like isoform X1 n=1 Tax=Helicoverpa zea TaxID=7113 RepID=UPI001F5833EF|nr:ecto-NOX disulfide-thiol exchanger 2-like isoform X1 [Helicoverpa zea]
MNSWGNEQFGMQNMMHPMPNMMPNMMQPGPMVPPLIPPFNMMGEMNQMQMAPMPVVNPPQNNGAFIGPVIPQTEDVPASGAVEESNEQSEVQDKRHSRDRNERRDRDRRDDRGRRRSRSRTRDQKDRGGRNRNEHRERQSKWDNNDRLTQQQNLQAHNNMIMQGNQMMQYNNMMQNMQNMQNPMMNQPMDMPGMAPMNYQANMIQQMIMMSPTVQMTTQSLYFSNGVVLPMLPGTTVPPRRDPLPGCRTIFIGGLPPGIAKETVREIFEKFGPVDDVKLHKQGVCHVRFQKPESVEHAFFISGCRIKFYNQQDSEAATIFIDYALNREDQNEHEKNKRKRSPTPPRVEQFSANTLVAIGEKIKSDNEFAEAAPTLAAWLERGECNKKNANTFYTLIQAANNQLRRLFNEKMQIDDEYQTLKNSMKDKFGHIVTQFEQVAKILTAAKIQRVSDHFSKQQRRNIEMWLKMTEELDNIREEYNSLFDEDENEKVGSKNTVPLEKYEQLRVENENLSYELEGYKNEAHLAKDEAERKFEKFKAHFIAQQALQQNKQVYPPLPPPPMPNLTLDTPVKPQPPPPLPDDQITSSEAVITSSEAKLISLLSAFLMVHPRGATLDYLASYVKSLTPGVTQSTVLEVLKKYNDVFQRKTTGVGACIEHKWCFTIFDNMKID